ncbi:hypothetical protein Tco_0603205 [Tanacetum coccineum]
MAYSSFLFLFSVKPNSRVSTTVVVSSSPQGSSQHAAQLHSGSSLLWPVYVQRDASNDANWCQGISESIDDVARLFVNVSMLYSMTDIRK